MLRRQPDGSPAASASRYLAGMPDQSDRDCFVGDAGLSGWVFILEAQESQPVQFGAGSDPQL